MKATRRNPGYVLVFGIVLVLPTVCYLAFQLRADTAPLKEFLWLLAPSFIIIAVSFIYYVAGLTAKRPVDAVTNKKLTKALRFLGVAIVGAIIALNVIGVVLLYVFSRDGSFRDWPYGYPSPQDEITCVSGLMPIPIGNAEAVREARKILLPLKPYIVESGSAHDIPPETIATFILVNRMIRAGYLTYDLRNGLGHVLWGLRIFPEQRNMYDLSPLYNRSEFTRWLVVKGIPRHIRIQDRAGDYVSGIIIGTSPTVGNMQIRADIIPGFENERNVRANELWARFDIDVSGLTDRQINQMLLRDPRLDIEAGVAALRQSIDSLDMVIGSDWYSIIRFINVNRGLNPCRETYDSITLYGFTQDQRVGSITEADYPLFYRIAVQSGVFSDTPGIITGVTTQEQIDYVRTFIAGEDSFLRDAALRTLDSMISQ